MLYLLIAVNHDDSAVFALQMLLLVLFEFLFLLVVLSEEGFNGSGFISPVLLQLGRGGEKFALGEFGIPTSIQVIFGERTFLFLIGFPIRKGLLLLRFEFLLLFEIDMKVLDHIARGTMKFSIRLLPD